MSVHANLCGTPSSSFLTGRTVNLAAEGKPYTPCEYAANVTRRGKSLYLTSPPLQKTVGVSSDGISIGPRRPMSLRLDTWIVPCDRRAALRQETFEADGFPRYRFRCCRQHRREHRPERTQATLPSRTFTPAALPLTRTCPGPGRGTRCPPCTALRFPPNRSNWTASCHLT